MIETIKEFLVREGKIEEDKDSLYFNLGKTLTRILHNLKLRRSIIEAIDTFDYEIVQDYLEMSGIPWHGLNSVITDKVPTIDDMRWHLANEITKVAKLRKIAEYHTVNNFIIYLNGNSVTVSYSIASKICGEKRKILQGNKL